jgi:nitrogen fixation NifU-like protein
VAFLENLYKEIILEHYKRPRNRREIRDATLIKDGINPSCGDELELYLKVEHGVVNEIGFIGEGCAISQASASMMTEAIRGKSVLEALETSRSFKAMIHGGEPAEDLGDLVMLQGISKLHARVKCATLSWVTLEQALSEVDKVS